MEQAKLKVCRRKASVSDPRCQAATAPASGHPFSPALLLPVVPSGLVSLFFLAGSGMMLEVELSLLLVFAQSSSRLPVVLHPPLSPLDVSPLGQGLGFLAFSLHLREPAGGLYREPPLTPVAPWQNLERPWRASPRREVEVFSHLEGEEVQVGSTRRAPQAQVTRGLRRYALRAGSPHPSLSAFPWSPGLICRCPERQLSLPSGEQSGGRGLRTGSTAGHLPFTLSSVAWGPNISQQLGGSPPLALKQDSVC